MPTVSIDDHEVSVPKGTTVIQAAEKLEIFIPRYCYHPGLSIAGNCRICLVEVDKFPKLQIACNTPVTDGMVVHTKSDKAEDGRRAVLEFLLANHPLDCPVCDQSALTSTTGSLSCAGSCGVIRPRSMRRSTPSARSGARRTGGGPRRATWCAGSRPTSTISPRRSTVFWRRSSCVSPKKPEASGSPYC